MKKRIITSILCAAFAVSALSLVFAAGGSEDPLISQSYLEQNFLPRITSYIDEKLDGLTSSNSGDAAAPEAFKVVSLSKGNTLIAEAGCEMILRSGSATIIGSKRGGISDTTDGCDLQNDAKMPANHLLIVPLSDGRGITATSDALVMIKGKYKIS